MYIIKNRLEDRTGKIKCKILIDGEWLDHIVSDQISYSDSSDLEEGDWLDVKPCDDSEKVAHNNEVERENKLLDLAALDLPLHTLALAISGDETAINKVKEVEKLKDAIRAEL